MSGAKGKAVGKAIEKLIQLSSEPLSAEGAGIHHGAEVVGTIGQELELLLARRNGFYCFESALHVFPTHSGGSNIGLNEWNSPELWKHEYGTLFPPAFCFGEDIFGNQFCIIGQGIGLFNPETAKMSQMAASLEEWAEKLLARYKYYTGYPLAHAWQKANGRLPNGMRLFPKVPFVLGGPYTLENVYAGDSTAGMRAMGNIARQMIDVPDGSQIRLVTSD